MSTTGSMTLSSNERERVEALLRAFLEGECSLEQLVDGLRGYMVVDFSNAPHSREMRNLFLHGLSKMPVEPRHLRRMLHRYIDGDISEMDLSNWAAFLLGPLDFVPIGDTEEERSEAGEGPVWDILQRLSTPMVFDGLDRQVAQHYLDMLG